MNIDNITELGKQLLQIGFPNMEKFLLKYICFNPENFELKQNIDRIDSTLLFCFQFERKADTDSYVLRYYDVTLQKQTPLTTDPEIIIDLKELEQRMSGVDWKNVMTVEQGAWIPTDKTCWEQEAAIEDICNRLAKLSLTEQGQFEASRLKLKHWAGKVPVEFTGIIPIVKSKTGITQRFFYTAGSNITIDEAFRYLNNKWIERQILQNSKQIKMKPEIMSESDVSAPNYPGSKRGNKNKNRKN
jgi:hypothetical protein